VRKSFGVLFNSALELVIRALTPNILKTVGLKS